MKKSLLKLAGLVLAAALAFGMVACKNNDDEEEAPAKAVWTKGENETITVTYPEESGIPPMDLECVSYSCPLPKGVKEVKGEVLPVGVESEPIPVTVTAEQECNVEVVIIRIKDGKVIIYTLAQFQGTEEDHNVGANVKLEGLPEKIIYIKIPMPE